MSLRPVASRAVVLAVLAALALLAGCGGPETAGAPGAAAPAETGADTDGSFLASPEHTAALRPWTGDLDGMVERRVIRVLVAYNKMTYFVDRGTPRGTAYELFKAFEADLNRRRKLGRLGVNVVFLPVSRDRLLADLAAGLGDVAAGNLTVTDERRKLVDFSEPLARGVTEIVVTGPGAAPISSLDDLSGRDVFVRPGSSYEESLIALNERFEKAGRAPAVIRATPPELEDEDLLEMTNAGLIPTTVVDRHLADFWRQVLPDLVAHENLALRAGADIAWAFRKGSPELAAALDSFVRAHGKGTKTGNVIINRYLKDLKFVKNAAAEAELAKYRQLRELFERYGDRYGMDWLLMAAQGYQESGLDQNVRSRVGAIGVMQIMPATGKEMGVGDIRKVEANIHAGVKYMRFMMDRYYEDEPMRPLDKALFTFASYNAGPARIRGLREAAEERGLDPNVWFNNVERLAAERIGQETVTYVSNIYKYYIAYKLIAEQREERGQAREALSRAGGGSAP